MLLLSLPWVGFTLDPQWHRIHLVPFSDPADKLRDLVANILLFIPFGYSAADRGRAPSGFAFALAAAALVSVAAEATQLFSTVRYPSATDVTAAVMGAMAGAALRKFIDLV